MTPEEGRNFKRNYKRLMWFLLGIFLIDFFIVFVLINYAHLSSVLAGFIIIVFTSICYLCFYLICAKIDKKKKEQQNSEKYKDPFTKK